MRGGGLHILNWENLHIYIARSLYSFYAQYIRTTIHKLADGTEYAQVALLLLISFNHFIYIYNDCMKLFLAMPPVNNQYR